MKKAIFIATVGFVMATAQAQAADIRVHYAIPTIWSDTQEKLAEVFMQKNPDIKVTIDGPATSYADGVQRLLRESIAGNFPDVAYVGLNRWRALESRGITKPLDSFIGNPMDFEKAGYSPALRSLGIYQGKQYALATSASTMVMYVNPDLVKRAGGSMENFPTTFDGIIKLAAKIDALGNDVEGVWIGRHDWRFQGVLGSHGGRPLNGDESDVTFDSDAGVAAATIYSRFFKESGMPIYRQNDARQAFPAGTLGIFFESSSLLNKFTEAAGKNFKVTVLPTPVVVKDKSKAYFPTGGSAIVMLTDDAEKQKAVWRYMLFVTGPEGAKIIVENTGYAPTNTIVLSDDAYLGKFYASNPNARVAHAQVAAHAGPWYAYPGPEGVAVTDLIGAALVLISEGDDPKATIKELAKTVRGKLKMK